MLSIVLQQGLFAEFNEVSPKQIKQVVTKCEGNGLFLSPRLLIDVEEEEDKVEFISSLLGGNIFIYLFFLFHH